MPQLYLFADVINHYEELIQNYPVRSTKTKNIGNRVCLVSVVKFIAERGLPFKDDKNVGSPKKFFQKIFKTFLKQNFKKRRRDVSSNWFCNSFTNR